MLERLNVQLNANSYKLDGHPLKYPSTSALSTKMSSSSFREYPPTPKSASRTFKALFPDHLSLLDLLPPNTGPAGTVETNGIGNLSTANKNLSHVPCKFFKQGICQAGKSCPFSHDLDGSTGADKLPCKYFQKGNCKFGLKCALAHFLPDGTRVNNKSLLSYRRNNDRSERSKSFGSHNSSTPSSASNPHTMIGESASYYYKTSSASYSSTALTDPIDIGAGSPYSNSIHLDNEQNHSPNSMPIFPLRNSRSNMYLSSNTTSQLQDAFGSGDWLSHHSLNFSSNLFSQSGNNFAPASGVSVSGLNQSPSDHSRHSFNLGSHDMVDAQKPTSTISLPSFGMGFQRRNSSSSSSPVFIFNQFVPDETVIDDDDNREDEEPFFEDYVPASIGNLILTPQEKKRRDSRSQSGTLLVRPTNLKSLHEPSAEKSWAQQIAPKDNESVFLMD